MGSVFPEAGSRASAFPVTRSSSPKGAARGADDEGRGFGTSRASAR